MQLVRYMAYTLAASSAALGVTAVLYRNLWATPLLWVAAGGVAVAQFFRPGDTG